MAPLAVQFALTTAGELVGATAWAWDFDGDGVADSTEKAPVWEFAEPGTNTVSVVLTREDGTSVTATLEDGVTVRKRLATVYQNDVIVLLDGDASKSADWEFEGWDEENRALQVRQVAATPAIAMAEGVKFIFAVDGEEQYRMKVAKAVEGSDGDDVWTVATTDVEGLPAIYKSLDWYASTVMAGGGEAGPTGRRDGKKGGSGIGGTQTFWDGFLTVSGGASAWWNYSISEGREYQNGAISFNADLDVGGEVFAEMTLERLQSEIVNIPFGSENLDGVLKLILSGGGNAKIGMKGHLGGHAKAGGTIHFEGNQGWFEPDVDFTHSKDVTLFGSSHFDVDMRIELNLKDNAGNALGLYGTAGIDYGVDAVLGTGGGSLTQSGGSKFGFGLSGTFGGTGKTIAIDNKRPLQDLEREVTRVGKETLESKGTEAVGAVADYIGGPAKNVSKMVKAMSGAGNSALATLAAQGEQLALGKLAAGLDEELKTANVEALRNPLVLKKAAECGVARGTGKLAEAGGEITDEAMQRMAANMPVGVLKKDVWDKAKAEVVRRGAASKYNEAAGWKKTAESVTDVEPPQTGAIVANVPGQRRGARRGGFGGTKEMDNDIVSATLYLGDGQSVSVDGEATVSLEDYYTAGGYYVATLEVKHEGLSLPPQYMLVQIQNWDVAGENFPTAAKALVTAMAEATGTGGINMRSDAWGTYNGDKVPLGFKALAGLNPVDWDSSGEGLIDDEWKLQQGLAPAKAKADDDPDGDSLDNWQEYQGLGADAENGTQAQARVAAMRRGGESSGPNQAAPNWTHPRLLDTDWGGVSDGDELLWGTDPNDGNDDKQPCKGCQKVQCRCPKDCECGGCEECMEKDEEED
ncbi:MAG: PKD domain-containing protein, partial [Kiritimatiellae bacterium]|nr:PKD domain-containing protein [Kiritimatiellia bacterium]